MTFNLAIQVFSQNTSETRLLSFILKVKNNAGPLFEQKMASFAKTYFKGEHQYRVQQVYGGANDGQFIMTKARMTNWAYYDDTSRNKENNAFWVAFNRDINPLLEYMHLDFLGYMADLSSIDQRVYAEKNTLTERIIKIDKVSQFESLIKKIKVVWENDKINIAVYKYQTGNPNKYVFARRHPSGWIDKDPGSNPVLKDEFIKKYSAAEWEDFGNKWNECIESTNIQLQYYRKDLSNNK